MREASIGCLSRALDWEPGPHPKHVPWQGIETENFGSQACAQSTEPHQPGPSHVFLFLCSFFTSFFSLIKNFYWIILLSLWIFNYIFFCVCVVILGINICEFIISQSILGKFQEIYLVTILCLVKKVNLFQYSSMNFSNFCVFVTYITCVHVISWTISS